jgi:YegS/Rv2252/BmrU family lipid kinase
MQIAVIFNPGAGESLTARQSLSDAEFETELLQTLRDLGREAEIYYTTATDPGEGIAKELAARQTDLVLVVGGDGTIHSVARGLLGSETTLGIIPAGTMNNLAYCLGIPMDLKEACALLVDGVRRRIDVGSINGHIFLEVAGIGLEAALYPAAEAVKSRGILSTLKGVLSGLSTLMKFRPPRMYVMFDHGKWRTYRAIQITICNTPYYGVRLSIAPGITANDGWLDTVVYTNFSKSEYIRHAISITQGRRPLASKTVYRRMKSLRIHTRRPIEIHADGTVIGTTPAEISLLPAVLKVLVPQKPAPGLLAEGEWPVNSFIAKGKAYV